MFKNGCTVLEALHRASIIFSQAGLDGPAAEGQYLFSKVLGWDRLKVLLAADIVLSPSQLARLAEAVKRRAGGEPLAYISGNREFYGLEFMVSPAVLIPRPESELLIDVALKWAERRGYCRGRGVRAIDLGTGSGNLVVTLALKWLQASLYAVDISSAALLLAKKNASRLGVPERISWHQGDFFSAFSGFSSPPQFNLIISNPPYISKSERDSLPLTVKDFEPVQALDGGTDGLEAYRKLLGGLSRHLLIPGLVAVEIGARQHDDVTGLFESTGLFQQVKVLHDYRGRPRIVLGVREERPAIFPRYT